MMMLESIWTLLNSPIGITMMAGALLWALNQIYAAKPMWAKFEGAIISAVKFAEKKIPDGTPNKGFAKLNAALQYVLKIYEEARGKKASKKIEGQLKEGIGIIHNRMEADGTLK